ncbi:MAG TPA: macro domain-containing protein [Bacteroidales bacterium]|nr:macro domain-containing protein [Bacteroidales bacterium]
MDFCKNEVTLQIRKGDITCQPDMEAIANAANAMLLPGLGVDEAIHRAAGPDLAREAHPKGPILPGQAVLTKGYRLPNKYVIHCLGPVFNIDVPHDVLLASCFQNALRICEENNIKSIAFPAISTGAFGYPPSEAAPVILDAIIKLMHNLKSIQVVRLVLFSQTDYDIFAEALESRIC